MLSGASLVIDMPAGDQVVRRPRPTDMIGAGLRSAFGEAIPLPADMTRLLALMDCRRPKH